MIWRTLLTAAVLAVVCRSAFADPNGLSVWVEADGASYLWNPTAAPISFDGYQLASESKSLDPLGWKSIGDYVQAGEITAVIAALGSGALSFGEAAPTSSNLAELNLANAGVIAPGTKFFIGKPFATLPPVAGWFYKIQGLPNGGLGEIVFAPDTPEPSTWLLAALAALGCAVIRKRR